MRKRRPRGAPYSLDFDTVTVPGPLSTPCREWKWGRSKCGGKYYGSSPRQLPGQYRAHQFYYRLIRGPVPAGLEIDHLCRNTMCVDPWHMEAVTRAQNTQRGSLAVLTLTEVVVLREYLKSVRARGKRAPHNALKAAFGIDSGRLSRIENGHIWKNATLANLLSQQKENP